MIPVSGEQHERAVEAIATEFCPREGCRHCRERACKALAEQGVRLVDLAEVTASLRAMAVSSPIPAIAAKLREAADAIERRFGGNERSEDETQR